MTYSKNEYYTKEDIARAKQLAKDFYNKTYSPQLLKNGNLKLASNVAIWDLPSVVTCKCKCNGCYALKAERMYKNTRVCRAFHYEIVKQALKDIKKREYLVKYIGNELSKHSMLYNLPVVRLHSSGDMFSKDYLEFWLEIIRLNPFVRFYTYTKILDNDTIDYYNKMYPNFNIVKSIINGKINYGELDYIQGIAKTLEVEGQPYKICGYGLEGNNEKCMRDCTACLDFCNILFKKH